MIDAATPRVVCPAITTGRLPVMRQLVEAGTLHERATTIFPSITPAATASIITGEYPAGHGIAGASWFDPATQEIAYYGDDFWVAAREGFGAFVDDFLMRLNGDRLLAPTLFETVEAGGRTAASLNYLIFKGLAEHTVTMPLLLNLLPGVRATRTVKGPSIFCLGDFAKTRVLRKRPLKNDKDGLLHRFGMDDAATGELLAELIEDGAMPDLTVAYFADNDYRGHEVGPYAALTAVERVDLLLGRALEAAGGLDRFLRDTFVVITSDHGHCEVLGDGHDAAIRLHEILSEFKQARLGGEPWRDEDEVMICPNMRAAQIYFQTRRAELLPRVVSRALSDPRIDLAAWRPDHAGGDAEPYSVASAHGVLAFGRGAGGSATGRDACGQVWRWNGDLAVLGGALDAGELVWTHYPNAFERLAGILDGRNSGDVWLTARPGCEFEVPGGHAHLGGASHGGLHALESLCPVIVAGPTRRALPEHFRTIDIAPLCLELLGFPTPRRVGQAT